MVIIVTFFFGMAGLSTIYFDAVIVFTFLFVVVGIVTVIDVAVDVVSVIVVGFIGVAGRVIVVSSDLFIVVVVTVIAGHLSDGALGLFTGDLKESSQLFVQAVQIG